MQPGAHKPCQRGPQGTPTEFRLRVNSPGVGDEFAIVRGRGGDYFVITPDARVVAVLVVLDAAAGLP